ncbi:uncharacterized protein STEHIDRAFT_112752 [Stereum hirsutum FP-91666 SS1]|uniref:uncharacterized protein n=1 Tax=Stereum hirsutum (strain FP-91666) TaxID=721885 RepID=UPI000444994E|nr:uncharacterized protein STEHIDRAFT_112752 [Stereum hirsutum FP-91666 SS1]EIM84350.1 hypothetical protein STEHIDRAFT_112752 [Stereum hirsutum FP-91666 SS1]
MSSPPVTAENLIQNAIEKLVLLDVVRDSLGLSIPIDLHRLNLPVDLIRPRTPHNEATPILFLSAAPTRPPSSLPPPHDITLRTSVAEYLGSGRTGLVYILSDPVLSDPNNKLPELVFKFPRSHRCADIYRESWFYEEMERLQGVAIPRCYERLGCRLPIGKPIPADVREDLHTLIAEIGYLAILNSQDIRHANILEAPQHPPGLASISSPFTHRTHGWRIIDFKMTAKSMMTPTALRQAHKSMLRPILDGLEKGYYAWESPF